jgi:hypothetical protein
MLNISASRSYQICNRCLMDTSDPDIIFDDKGNCNHCNRYFVRVAEEVRHGSKADDALGAVVARIASEGKGKEYDCVAGVSGGVDNTYVIYKLKQLGLRPLAVHFE